VAFTEHMVDLVLGNGGTLKAEHGTGRIMAPFVRRQYGDELYEVMLAVKRLCDPAGVLNPGAVLTEDPLSHVSNLNLHPRSRLRSIVAWNVVTASRSARPRT
jgi:D-lactate dehydrogenase